MDSTLDMLMTMHYTNIRFIIIIIILTLTHTITAYSVSGNVVRVRILICATRQKPCRKRVDLNQSNS